MAGKKKTNKERKPEPRKKARVKFDNLFVGIDPALAGPDSTYTTADFNAASTLTEDDIVDAINMLRTGRKTPAVPDVDMPGASWATALAIAFIKTMGVRLKETPQSVWGSMLQMEMRFPLGRHSYEQTMNATIETAMSEKYAKDPNELLKVRVMMLERMLHEHFESLYQWVDIAKRVKTEYKVEDILKIKNIEQRMAALRIFGAEKLIEETHAKLVSKTPRGNELFLIPKEMGFFDEDAYFLKYSCTSTGRIYVSGVPNWLFNTRSATVGFSTRRDREMFQPGFGVFWNMRGPDIEPMYLKEYPREMWADVAMAWKFRLSPEEYQQLFVENEG